MIKIFQNGCPELGGVDVETGDPVAKGFEQNLPLFAFHWASRRFVEAPKYCLVNV